MSEEVVKALIVALFGTGGATFIWTLVKSYIAWRGSAELREDKVIARLEEFERRCREELACERRMGHYWFNRAGTLEYELRKAGLPIPEMPPKPHPFKRDSSTLDP